MKGSQHVPTAKLPKNRPISASHLRSAGGPKNDTYTCETRRFGQARSARGRCINCASGVFLLVNGYLSFRAALTRVST
jgi:hypothetical protein